MISALTYYVLAAIALLQVMFMAGLAFVTYGLIRDWIGGTSDRLSRALLMFSAVLVLERLWLIGTFSLFSPGFVVSPERLINLILYFIILLGLNGLGFYLTWELYRDDR